MQRKKNPQLILWKTAKKAWQGADCFRKLSYKGPSINSVSGLTLSASVSEQELTPSQQAFRICLSTNTDPDTPPVGFPSYRDSLMNVSVPPACKYLSNT